MGPRQRGRADPPKRACSCCPNGWSLAAPQSAPAIVSGARAISRGVERDRDGRELREITRSTDPAQAAQLLEQRLAEAATTPGGPVLFDDLATRYLEEYALHEFRSGNTAAGRVAHLRAVFGGQPVIAITTDAIRAYQRQRRDAGAAAATVNRETSALSRMLRLGIEAGQLTTRPLFPAVARARPAAGVLRARGVTGGAPTLALSVSFALMLSAEVARTAIRNVP